MRKKQNRTSVSIPHPAYQYAKVAAALEGINIGQFIANCILKSVDNAVKTVILK